MTEKLEKEIERKAKEYARSLGALALKFNSPARRNVPDAIFVFSNIPAFWIEFKAPGKKPTKGQYREMKRLKDRGQDVYWTDNLEKAKEIIDSHHACSLVEKLLAPTDIPTSIIDWKLCAK